MDRNLRLTDLKNQLKHFTDQNIKLHDEQIIVQKKYDQVIQLFNNIHYIIYTKYMICIIYFN